MKLEQILQLEVGCLNFGSIQDSAINLTYPTMLFWVGTVGKKCEGRSIYFRQIYT